MAYDESLVLRINTILADQKNLVEKKMFGGVGYLLNGNMACGVNKEYLIVRVGPDDYQEALEHLDTKILDITGRPMTGWVMVTPAGCESQTALESWVGRGISFARTLPPK
jgi:TfoX/Sxy family transcriptional regulator of competence genes